LPGRPRSGRPPRRGRRVWHVRAARGRQVEPRSAAPRDKMRAMSSITPLPGCLLEGQRRPKAIRLAGRVDWYLVTEGRFELVGSGDVSDADLRSVHGELGGTGVFVCVAKPVPLETYLPKANLGTKRITRSSKLKVPTYPKLRWVAKGARLAVLPDMGTVWVDGEHLFKAGEAVPLPWTEPLVELIVVRPAAVYAAMKAVLGPDRPKRAAAGSRQA
jgi:hypothetical protein